jgi:hypothetical protein
MLKFGIFDTLFHNTFNHTKKRPPLLGAAFFISPLFHFCVVLHPAFIGTEFGMCHFFECLCAAIFAFNLISINGIRERLYNGFRYSSPFNKSSSGTPLR